MSGKYMTTVLYVRTIYIGHILYDIVHTLCTYYTGAHTVCFEMPYEDTYCMYVRMYNRLDLTGNLTCSFAVYETNNSGQPRGMHELC